MEWNEMKCFRMLFCCYLFEYIRLPPTPSPRHSSVCGVFCVYSIDYSKRSGMRTGMGLGMGVGMMNGVVCDI